MLFNSFDFLIFFPFVTGLYFFSPCRWRWAILLGASYYFYMCWKPEYAVLLLFSTSVDYFAGIQMAKSKTQNIRKLYLLLSLMANLSILFAFKYLEFFATVIQSVFGYSNFDLPFQGFDLLLPLGISFYTFQSLSYSIDVYKNKIEPEKHFGLFALYISFFPQLVAGPIERAGDMIPQLKSPKYFDGPKTTSGLQLMLWGFFKKIVVADQLSLYVEAVFDAPVPLKGIPVLMAFFLFTIQIYCDFSGYCDIAIGAARVLGIDLTLNFKRPFFAQSIPEFWTRWHITLSRWFRDYLYIPLGGNRVPRLHWYLNIVTIFFVSGLWHGAGWNYIIWGGIHGLLYLGWRIFANDPIAPSFQAGFLKKTFNVCLTFCLVVFAFVFFRAESSAVAFRLLRNSFELREIHFWSLEVTDIPYHFPLCLLGVAIVLGVDLLHELGYLQKLLQVNRWLRWAIYIGIVLAIINFGNFGGVPFVYFQF